MLTRALRQHGPPLTRFREAVGTVPPDLVEPFCNCPCDMGKVAVGGTSVVLVGIIGLFGKRAEQRFPILGATTLARQAGADKEKRVLPCHAGALRFRPGLSHGLTLRSGAASIGGHETGGLTLGSSTARPAAQGGRAPPAEQGEAA